jgi:hypothetical protein
MGTTDVRTVLIDCTCRYSHKLEVREYDGSLSIIFWTNIRNWMSLGTRVRKAFEVLFHGATILDDIEIGDVGGAKAAAKILNEWADAEHCRRIDSARAAKPEHLDAMYKAGLLHEDYIAVWVHANKSRIDAGELVAEIKKYKWMDKGIKDYELEEQMATDFTNGMRAERSMPPLGGNDGA